MCANHDQNEEQIYYQAVSLPPKQRATYLKQACGDDHKLLRRVEALLKAHSIEDDFLEAPVLDQDVTLENAPLIEGPGTRIGRYELLELIGEGGMGLVYLAEQKEPVKRRVALKIIKPGMDTRQVIARFEAERQALAVLDHPNIARVFDAGTTQAGRPYFVMEHVKGMPITAYCDKHKLDIEQRLKLFRQVCEGIHHAHQKGIIHRDIKPSNILVTLQDDKAVPKIIDFGIAKAATQPLTDKTLFTSQGQLLGTPQYMSPEQVDLATHDIDTRSDIYSLGVVLYELLAGALPFEAERFERVGLSQIQHTIREVEPASPSIRLTALGEDAKAIAASRGTQVIPLARRLHRELEWIPLKAMRKERVRRYRSASELADDIQNYLNGNPLIAGPETTIYRVRKFVRRHAGSVATVALVATAISLGLVISTAMYIRAERARENEFIARSQAEQAEKLAQEQKDIAQTKAEDLRRAMYVNNIQLANSKYHEGNIRRVRELLDSCPNDLRGWEWHRLNYISDQSLMTLRGHQDGVTSIALSPDGKRIASGSNDETIKVWDVATGAELITLTGHKDVVNCVAFSPDGKQVVSGGYPGKIKVWDAASGAEVMNIPGHDGWIISVGFSPDGKRLLSASSDSKVIKVWDATTGVEVMTLPGHLINSVAISPDGKKIVSGSNDETIKVWDVATGKELLTLQGHQYRVISVAFSPDSKFIVSGGADRKVKVWDVQSGKEVMALSGHNDWVSSVSFSPDGKFIVSGGKDNTIKIWDTISGEEVKTFRGHYSTVYSVAFSPDGKRIISGSGDQTIKIWDAEGIIDVVKLGKHLSTVRSVAFRPDGKRIVSGSGDQVKIWDVATGAEVMNLRGAERGVSCLAFSPEGKYIVSAGPDIMIWDAESGTRLLSLRGHVGTVPAIAFTPDGTKIISGGMDKMIKAWNVATGTELKTLKGHRGGVRSVAVSSDGKRIASASDDGEIKMWDISTGAEVMSILTHQRWTPGVSVAFSPDGKRIASAPSRYGIVKVWDTATGVELMTLSGHRGGGRSVVFGPGGNRIITGSDDGTVKVWDAERGVELMTLNANIPILSVAFSPDGKSIAASASAQVILWESEVPAGGYGPRKNGEVARKIVDELYDKLGYYCEIINKLQADKTLDEPLRKLALQIADSRKWWDAETFNDESWEVVSSPDKDAEDYKLAMEKAAKATRMEPNDCGMLNTLGIAQYRLGAYQDALMTLSRADKMRTDANQPSTVEDWAFIAMSLHKLGRVDEAKVSLERLGTFLQEERFLDYEEAKAFLGEAEKLIEGEKQ